MIAEGNPLLNRIINRNTLLLTIVAVLGYNLFTANTGAMPFYQQQANQFDAERAYQSIINLTDDKLYGRALGSAGTDLSALYVAHEFEQIGLQAGGEKQSYFQIRKRSFERLLSEPILYFEDNRPALVYGKDFAAYRGRNMTAGMAVSPVRFIALGKDAANTSRFASSYPKLDRADFTGEILLVLSDREAYYLASLPKDGMLVITNDPSLLGKRFTLSGCTSQRFSVAGFEERPEYPSIWISEQTANRLLSGSGKTVEDLREYADNNSHKQVSEIPIDINTIMAVNGVIEKKWPVKNVIGLWPGSISYDNCMDCAAKKLIVVMAKYDSPPVGPEGIYPAAIDNASGLAVLLETVRVMKETEYQPYKSFLFVAYSGEGLDGGEPVDETDISKILQANPSFSNFDLESIIILRGLGGESGEKLEISAEGSLRLTEIFERAARQMGVKTLRSSDPIDISMVYDESNAFFKRGQEAPILRLYWEGWGTYSRLPNDILSNISEEHLKDAGRTLSLALMMMGRVQD